jgi:hypothetical protein
MNTYKGLGYPPDFISYAVRHIPAPGLAVEFLAYMLGQV